MSVLVPQRRPSSSATDHPAEAREALTRHGTLTLVPAPAQAPDGSEIHRWLLVLGAPFVLGAAFFGLAIALDAEWPMAPAFVFGPLLMIAGYIVLSLTSEANSTSD
jgi:hypothetical protein